MSWEIVRKRLLSNKNEDIQEAIRILVKISDNIINNPANSVIRRLKKSNNTIATKVLAINGGPDCLKLMGFEEDASGLTLPLNSSLNNLKAVKSDLIRLRENIASNNSDREETKPPEQVVENRIIRKIELPPLANMFSNQFLKVVEQQFHQVLAYEDADLQKRARNLLPLKSLEIAALENLRGLQMEIKKKKLDDLNVSVQDLMMLELLNWFRNDFFTWVDTPDCDSCGGKTRMSHLSSDPKDLVYTDRVEIHRCESCDKFTSFPRYEDLNILLETRRGRCGEWANTFTLFCRALGWDARFVSAMYEDHVWTEVYSFAQKRWLHCDPCEDVCDKPLMYEAGWGKKFSYVMAFSVDEVQDVTWRYSAQHKAVLQRRKKCSESELIDAMVKLREVRQKNCSPSKKLFLQKRVLFELLEFLIEKNPSNADAQGRTSGSLEWRLERSEMQNCGSYSWVIDEAIDNITIRYSPSLDIYEYLCDSEVKKEIQGWNAGAFKAQNMLRKEEKDWKMVYICRKEGTDTGKISWKFDIASNKVIDSINLDFDFSVFETGDVKVTVSAENVLLTVPKDQKTYSSTLLSGKKSFTITATLSGGKGDHQWQHAQLFRQQIDCGNFSFILKLRLKNV